MNLREHFPLTGSEKFLKAESTAMSFPGCKISLKLTVGDFVPAGYALLDDGVRGKIFPNGSSIIIEFYTP